MNSTTQIITHFFLLSLAFGTQLFSAVVSTKLTGVGFYKLGTSIVLACLVLAVGVDLFMDPAPVLFEYLLYGVLIISNVVTMVFHRDFKSPLMWALYILQILTFGALTFFVMVGDAPNIVLFLTSMAFLGISNFAMILGHYYLVVPKLSEKPLINCVYIFWAVITMKLILSAQVLLTKGIPFLIEGTTLGDGFMYNWLFVSMRYLWGYVAPLVLSFFTYKLCRLRSIQSATGVLYIMEFFVIVGELVSIYLMGKHGLPL